MAHSRRVSAALIITRCLLAYDTALDEIRPLENSTLRYVSIISPCRRFVPDAGGGDTLSAVTKANPFVETRSVLDARVSVRVEERQCFGRPPSLQTETASTAMLMLDTSDKSLVHVVVPTLGVSPGPRKTWKPSRP